MEEFESVSKEAVIGILQQKSKELKSYQNKLTKIEEKYIKIFKENKLLIKDRESFTKCFQTITNDFQEQQPGEYDPNSLFDIHENSLKEQKKQFQKQLNEKDQQINNLKNQISEIQENNAKKTNNQIQNLENKNFFLEKDFASLQEKLDLQNEQLQIKEDQISHLKDIESQLSLIQSEQLLKGLKNGQEAMDIKNQINENELKNKLLVNQNLLENANLKILQLQNQLDPSQYSIPSFEKKIETSEKQNQTQIFTCQQCIELEALKTQIEETKKGKPLDREYLKQVVYRYMCYQESKNISQAQVLQLVLIDLMQMSPEEIKHIQEAKKQGSLWNSTKVLFGDIKTKYNL